ncbi:MAG: zf-HC2 domain-containing protein [Bryobacterales bacterium]|nr:zf-HC2 domain-containing protein [Bryobacterales bacterium]
MTCAEFEILLCDYVDGTLRADQKAALEDHRSGCPACKQLAEDVAGVTAFFERVPRAEPPAELLTRILHHAPAGRGAVTERLPGDWPPSWLKRLFVGFRQSFLQPRYVMGMAMTILSFSMLARFAHIEPRQLKPSDLDPVKVWQSIDDHSHRAWDRAMKYYDNLRLVIEIQSRLEEMKQQDPSQSAGVATGVRSGSPPAASERGSQQ